AREHAHRVKANARTPAAPMEDLVAAAARHEIGTDAFVSLRQPLRQWIETVALPRWAEQQLSAERAGARTQLERARLASEWLEQSGGDAMPLDSVLAIERVYASDPGAIEPLARAHLEYREVLQRFDAGDVAGARQAFERAQPALKRARSPYRH